MADVTILRDDWGMPHVRAGSEEDAFFGVGWAQAEDHLPLIARYYAQLRGELAQAFGRADDALTADVLSLRWRHLVEARAALPRLSPQVRHSVEAFVAGIQAYVDAHPERRPDHLPPLEPALALAMTRFVLFGYYVLDGIRVCMDNGIELGAEISDIVPLLEARRRPIGASNEWLLMPWRTADDALMLLSDPHGSLEGMPMFEVEVDAGPLKYVGFHVIGAPFPAIGHTRDVAWAFTTGSPVVSDCYAVEVEPGDPSSYRYDGQSRSFVQHDVTIQVRDEAELERRTFEYTDHNGVLSAVVAREGTRAYVVSSPYMHVPDLYEEQLYAQLHATSVDEFYDTMRPMGQYPQNVMIGDSAGNALYVRGGRTPIRPEGLDLSKPLDGNSSSTAWLGIHPLEDLVQIRNPSCGYLQNNNVAPDCMTADTTGTTLEASRYPDYIFGDKPGRTNSRGVRAVELLSRSLRATVAGALSIAVDDKLTGIETWQAALAAALDADPRLHARSSAFRLFAQLLLSFDGHAKAGSSNALRYWCWRTAMLSMDEVTDSLLEKVDGAQPLSVSEQALLVEAVEAALEHMRANYGSMDVPLGEVFRIGRGGRSYPGRAVAIAARKVPDRDQPFDSHVMPLHLMMYGEPDALGQRWAILGSHTQRLTVFTEPVQSFSLLNFGQSSDPHSPHHSDQARLFSEGRLRRTYFNASDLAGHVMTTTTLRP